MEELDPESTEDNGFLGRHLNNVKRWFLSHAQYMNFFTVLVLASVSSSTFYAKLKSPQAGKI